MEGKWVEDDARFLFRGFGPAIPMVGNTALPIGGRRERALLAALLLNPGEHQSVKRLVQLLWPGAQPRDPGHAIRTLVMRLRRHLDADLVETTAGGYRIDAAANQVDVHRFEALLRRAKKLAAARRFDEAFECYGIALRLATGGEPWEDLLKSRCGLAASNRIVELTLTAEEDRAELGLTMGQLVIGTLSQLTTEQPLRERRWCLLMTALYRSGSQSEALRAYADARMVLRNQIGVSPGPELIELERLVLAHEPLT